MSNPFKVLSFNSFTLTIKRMRELLNSKFFLKKNENFMKNLTFFYDKRDLHS